MSLICFSSINFFPSIPHPINQICCCGCISLWKRGLRLYEVNAAEPRNLHSLKFYVCCSFLLVSSAKNYLGYKTKTQVHPPPQTYIYLATRFQIPFSQFGWEMTLGGSGSRVLCVWGSRAGPRETGASVPVPTGLWTDLTETPEDTGPSGLASEQSQAPWEGL